jgi:hypothetical protein
MIGSGIVISLIVGIVVDRTHRHGRMARGGHGLLNVSLGPAMLNPSMPCGRATPETALRWFQVWPSMQGGWPAAVFYPFGRPMPYAYAHRLVEAAKGCFGVACLGLFAFTAAANYQNEMALVAISICTFGGFALAAYPILLELGVECTFPVPEATSSGLIFLLGELIALVGMELGEAVATEISAADKAVQKCLEVTTSNSTTSNSTIRYLSSTVSIN